MIGSTCTLVSVSTGSPKLTGFALAVVSCAQPWRDVDALCCTEGGALTFLVPRLCVSPSVAVEVSLLVVGICVVTK